MSSEDDPNRGQDDPNRGQNNDPNRKGKGKQVVKKKRKPSMKPFVPPVVRLMETEGGEEGSSRGHPRLDERETLVPGGNSFVPGHEGGEAVTKSIWSRNFHPGAGSWTLVPEAVRQHYWREFQKKCVWLPEYDEKMYKLFKDKCKYRYNNIMNKLHNKYLSGKTFELGKLPDKRDVWDTLVEYWNTPGFQERSRRASANRRSNPDGKGMAKHLGGSRAVFERIMKHKQDHGEDLDFFRGMQISHPFNEETGESTYFRTTEIHRKMKKAISDLTQSQQSPHMSGDSSCAGNPPTSTQIDKSKLYLDVVGVSKGRIVGLGNYGKEVRRKYKSPSYSIDSCPPPAQISQEKYDALVRKTMASEAKLQGMRRWVNEVSARLGLVPPPEAGESSGANIAPNVNDDDDEEEEEEEEEDEDDCFSLDDE